MQRVLIKRAAIVALLAALVAVFFIFDLGRFFTLQYIKASQEGFAALYEGNRATVIAAYMALYILVTSLSLPGAAMMTLAGGAMFGLLVGTVVISFASTIGATIACLVSRFLLRDWVQGRFGEKLSTVNSGVEREGAFYLFTLRLIPAFPFWLINLAMGLTPIAIFKYYWVSQIGMLPGTIVYVNAGKELAKIESLSGVLSPGLIASFVVLGLFPIVTKKLMAFFKSRRPAPGAPAAGGGG